MDAEAVVATSYGAFNAHFPLRCHCPLRLQMKLLTRLSGIRDELLPRFRADKTTQMIISGTATTFSGLVKVKVAILYFPFLARIIWFFQVPGIIREAGHNYIRVCTAAVHPTLGVCETSCRGMANGASLSDD